MSTEIPEAIQRGIELEKLVNPDWIKIVDGLNELQRVTGAVNLEKGFHEDRPELPGPEREMWVGNKLMLAVSELVEAHDEVRTGHPTNRVYDGNVPGKPEGFPVEVADALIREADIAYTEGFPLGVVVMDKIRYNMTRPRKHGRKF